MALPTYTTPAQEALEGIHSTDLIPFLSSNRTPLLLGNVALKYKFAAATLERQSYSVAVGRAVRTKGSSIPDKLPDFAVMFYLACVVAPSATVECIRREDEGSNRYTPA